MLLNIMHTNPMDMVMYITDMKILLHHTHLLKTTSKTFFERCAKRGKSCGNPKSGLQPKGSINIVFLCANQERREDTLLNEEVVECLNQEEVHEYLEDVKVEDEDKEPKEMKSVYSVSSGAAPSKLLSELKFEWVNLSDLNYIDPKHYGLLETDGQLRALCEALDKKKVDAQMSDHSSFKRSLQIPKTMYGLTKSGTPKKALLSTVWRLISRVGVHRGFVYTILNLGDQCNNKNWWKFQEEFKHKPP
ncbi:hypothetical protein PIB30_053986 [Stylosanthes scabra]|uniref:Uncharacterized protein n=1 Tax=Stylosanthes scabra TaxID=79078 RepID=A0ABU6RJ01_9FABA|nr:hypothetical protein [Stylosanthes scabra]